MLESCGARNAITNNGLLRKAKRASGIGMSGQTEKKERTPFQIKPCIPNAHFLSCGSIALEIGSVHSTRGGEGPPSSLVPLWYVAPSFCSVNRSGRAITSEISNSRGNASRSSLMGVCSTRWPNHHFFLIKVTT